MLLLAFFERNIIKIIFIIIWSTVPYYYNSSLIFQEVIIFCAFFMSLTQLHKNSKKFKGKIYNVLINYSVYKYNYRINYKKLSLNIFQSTLKHQTNKIKIYR